MSDEDKNANEFKKHEEQEETTKNNNEDNENYDYDEEINLDDDLDNQEEFEHEEEVLDLKNNNKMEKQTEQYLQEEESELNNNNDDQEENVNVNEDNSKHSNVQDEHETNIKQNNTQPPESPERLYKKLEIIKDIKSKTLNLQRIKTRLAQEVECIETESKCLHDFQNELELLTQEKLAHLEELRQIQNDIITMENTIKQADEEKRKALEMARRLHIEYRPLKDQINQLRESIGLEKTDDNEDVDIIETFLNKLQPFNDNKSNNKLNSSDENQNNNKTEPKLKHKTSKQISTDYYNESSSISPTINNKTSSNIKSRNQNNEQNYHQHKSPQNILAHQQQQQQQQNLLKSQSMDLPLQLATVALMAHSLRSKSPQSAHSLLSNQANLPYNVFNNNQTESQQINAENNPLKQFSQFVMNQNKETSNNNNISNNSASQIQSIPPPSFRQQPPPMKSCLSCGQQIHRNAPICPLCKAKSRSRNPKKPKQKDTANNLMMNSNDDISPCSSSSNIINYNTNTSMKGIQKVKHHAGEIIKNKNRC